MACRASPAVAAVVALSACGGPLQPHSPGAAIPTNTKEERYVILRDVTNGAVIVEGDLAEIDFEAKTSDSASGYVATVSASDGYSVLRAASVTPRDIQALALDKNCVPVRGAIHPGVVRSPVYFEPWTQDLAAFAVRTKEGGEFSACLPPANYAVSTEVPGLRSIAAYWNGRRGERVEVSTYAMATIREAPLPGEPASVADLAQVVADTSVRVVGVGEPDHGSRSYLELREKVAFAMASIRPTTIALEAGPVEVFPLDRYISGEDVDLRSTVSRLGYWIWDTEEFIAMMEHLRSYNAMFSPRRIAIAGADVQIGAGAAAYLVAHRRDAGLSEQEVVLLSQLRDESSLRQLSPAQKQRIVNALNRLTESAVDGFSPKDRVVLSALALRGRLAMLDGIGLDLFAARDAGMAAIVLALARGAGAGAVAFFAHNTHVSSARTQSVAMAGWYLREELGSGYHAIAMSAYNGVTRAYAPRSGSGVEELSLPAPPTGTVDAVLSEDGKIFDEHGAQAVLVLKEASPRLRAWLQSPRSMRDFGAAYPGDDRAWTDVPIMGAFDSIAVLRDVRPTTPTATGRRPAKAN